MDTVAATLPPVVLGALYPCVAATLLPVVHRALYITMRLVTILLPDKSSKLTSDSHLEHRMFR